MEPATGPKFFFINIHNYQNSRPKKPRFIGIRNLKNRDLSEFTKTFPLRHNALSQKVHINNFFHFNYTKCYVFFVFLSIIAATKSSYHLGDIWTKKLMPGVGDGCTRGINLGYF